MEVEGGYVLRVHEAYRDFPQGILCGVKTGQAPSLLEREGGTEGTALSLAFALALEDARGMRLPAAAVALRAVILESARAQAHLAWIGATASVLHKRRVAAVCESLRRELGEAMEKWLGEPSGRGWVVPGGLKEEFPLESAEACGMDLADVAATWEKSSPRATSLPVPRWMERKMRPLLGEGEKNAWVGPLARAAGGDTDVRKEEPGVYHLVEWEGAPAPEGAGILRRMLAIRAGEVASSLQVARRILAEVPDTPLLVKRGRGGRGEGFGRCEGPEGEVCCHVALEKGRVCFVSFSLPHELNRSAAHVVEGCRLDEADILSILWE
jgi:Ni,Fe-hydrogenase III large subunit